MMTKTIQKRRKAIHLLYFLLSGALLFPLFSGLLCHANAASAPAEQTYNTYNYTAQPAPSGATAAAALQTGENGAAADANGNVSIPAGGRAEFRVELSQPGDFAFSLCYQTIEGSGDVELSVLVDGKQPFDDVQVFNFPRLYEQDELIENDGTRDDTQPETRELAALQQRYAFDSTGYRNEPYLFPLTAGAHTVSLEARRGGLTVAALGFAPYEPPVDYATYRASVPETAGQGSVVLQGERLTSKTDTTILPQSDPVSADTYPQSSYARVFNTVGGGGWKNPRSAVSWRFHVDVDGVYSVALRFRQNVTSGIFSSRKLSIDGQVPFAEAERLTFDYSDDWQQKVLGDEAGAYGFYLTAGDHLLTLEAVVGDLAEYLSEIDDRLTKLNRIYRDIVMITGVSPDPYRDYGFDRQLPEQIAEMGQIHDDFEDLVDRIVALAGVDAGYTTILQKLIFQLEKMTEQPRRIAKYLKAFQSNLGSLASWLLDSTAQPLQIDWIYIGDDPAYHQPGGGFFHAVGHWAQRLLSSFVKDYNSIGVADGKQREQLTVWTQLGRDQAEVLRQLIDTRFCAQHDVSVKLQLVAAGTLLPSILAGTGPDVVLNNPASDPINYAIRNAVTDLTQFDDFEEVEARFFPAAVSPFRFNGSVYALPETFSFPMFFYRKDIFAEYGWQVPETLREMRVLASELQAKNMNMSFPVGLVGYGTVLFQNGGGLYEGEGVRSALGSDVALSSFEEYMKLYTLYAFPASYNFANRFRTGEMPCGVEDYTIYNTLSVYAPEIEGLWEMVPVPGTRRADGSLDRSAVGTAVGTMIVRSSDKQALAWEFVKWWLSDDLQSVYGRNLESILGSAAKYNTANREAIRRMTWSYQEYNALTAQAENAKAVPEVPGGYYLARTITFAFNRTYNANAEQSVAEDPTEVLRDYIPELNDELTRKRNEFGLED